MVYFGGAVFSVGAVSFVGAVFSGGSVYFGVYRIVAGAAHRLGITADALLGGPHHAWAVTYLPHAVLTR